MTGKYIIQFTNVAFATVVLTNCSICHQDSLLCVSYSVFQRPYFLRCNPMMAKMFLNILPKDTTDYPAYIFMNLSFIAITIYELVHVLPTVDENSLFGFSFHFVLGLFFLINIYGNYIMVIKTDSSTKGIFLPTMLKEGWK